MSKEEDEKKRKEQLKAKAKARPVIACIGCQKPKGQKS